MSSWPFFQFRSAGLPDDQAFEEWRNLMSPVFTVDSNPLVPHPPRGDISSYVVGDIMTSRTTFNAQRITRSKRLAGSTPDHLMFQFYHSGGFTGEIAGQTATLRRGLVAVCDMRQGFETQTVRSNTAGLSIPRSLLPGVGSWTLRPVLEPHRNRLLAARIVALQRDLRSLDSNEVATVTAELVAFVRRIFDRSSASDVLEGAELDAGVRVLAERVIARELGSRNLSPTFVAAAIKVSRATLYRAFAPDGVMDYVRHLRLDGVHHALSDPGERRSLAQVAADHGFSSLTLLGRSYRARFGLSPRDARAATLRAAGPLRATNTAVYHHLWRSLGSR